MKKGKLIKVTFEYENATSILKGSEMCEAWKKDIDGALQIEQLRNTNVTFSGLEEAEWELHSKKQIRKMKLDELNEKNI